MIKKRAYFFICLIVLMSNVCCLAVSANNLIPFDEEIAQIRYNVTAIEHIYSKNDNAGKTRAYEELIKKADKLVVQYPDRAEPYVWEGIALSAQAKYKGIGAISNVNTAKALLEKSVKINPDASGAAGLNALGMLYYKVPAWPVSFGNDKKAQEYFHRALSISSNLDTNYRYGEFLLEESKTKEGLSYLNKALNFPLRSGRKEDPLKKEDIKKLIEKYKG